MDTYREHEAVLMIETLTKNCETKKDKLLKVLLNFRNDLVFAKCALNFFTKEYLGVDGPLRLKQASFLAAYILLLLSL